MTDRLDRLLSETVHDLAVDADVISERDRSRLAVHAIDRAHTLRTRRRGSVVAVVTLVTALAVGVPYGLRYLDSRLDPAPAVVALPAGVAAMPGVPTHLIDETSAPIELVDGWYVAGNQLVLDPRTRSYQSFGRPEVAMLSPTGRWVAAGNPTGYRVYDLEFGGSARYDIGVNSGFGYSVLRGFAQWSPDGETLLASFGADRVEAAAELIDVTTQTAEFVIMGSTPDPCLTCEVSWMPSGTELAMAVGTSDDQGLHVTGVQTFALDGTPSALLPIRGIPAGVGAWSPDGRHVIVNSGPYAGAAQIVDVATGDVLGSLDRVNLAQAQWIDNRRFLSWEPIITDNASTYRALVSLRTIDGDLLERWIPPTEIVRIDVGPLHPPLAIHLG
jgi:hypothetical protein